MKKILLGTAVLGGLFMASCTEDIYDENRVKEDYTQNFIEQFGPINENQDWNMAAQKSVTVNPGEASEVQIYAKSGDVYKLVGHYQNVSGTQTLTFDAAKGVDDFVVTAGGQGKLVKNGESVSFADAGTRSYENWDRNDAFTVNDEYTNFPWNDVMAYAERLPNDEHNVGGVDGPSTDFNMIMGNEKITVYPVYWNASFDHTLGIYWYNNRGRIQTQDIYTDKEGDDVQVYVKRTEDTHRNPDTYEGWEDVTWDTFESPADVTTGYGWNRITYKGEIVTSYGINSRGFTIDLPYGTRYGFYIKVDDDSWYGNTYYTDPSVNRDNDGKGVMAAYFKQKMEDGTTRTFVGFEDQYNNSGDKKDLNDLMLMIDPSPIVIDNDVQEWIIAAEDLGATDDYDFNDVVFSVEHASGRDYATITPLAAGGSKATYLYRDGTQIGGGEFHTLLGGSVNENGSYAFVNTESAGPKGSPITIDVPVDFSLAYGDDTNMGNFSLQVDGVDTSIEAPGKGAAPQMICVPAGWKWPVERTNISVAYPDFGSWGANYQNSEWYRTPVDGKVLGNSN